MTWLIQVSGHDGFVGVTPPEECPHLRILSKKSNEHNTDKSKNADVENQYEGAQYTFTSAHDPSENTGVYKTNTEFTMSVLNGVKPLMLQYGGKYVTSGKDLKLEWIFPVQFPFGVGGPKRKRPTKISEIECLKHYFRLSLPQFMRGDFILVVLHMFNRMKSFENGIITCRSLRINGMLFADVVAKLTEQQIQKATKNLRNNIDDQSIAAKFLLQVESSCKAVGYTSAAARANRRLLYAMCDRFGIPGIFFTLTPDYLNTF